MGKGLLRKALHGAATSASGMLANKIEEKRQTRLMDYEAMRQRENQDYRYGQEKEMFGMEVDAQTQRDETGFERSKELTGMERQNQLDVEALRLQNQRTLNQEEATRRQGESEVEFQRRIQERVFESGMSREEETFKSGLSREEKAAEFKLRMDEIKEEARIAAERAGVDLTDIKFTVPDSMGNPTPVTMSARIDPETGTVRLFDSGTGQFVSAREMAAIDEDFATLAAADSWYTQVKDQDQSVDDFRESAQAWVDRYGSTPIPDVYTRQLPQEFRSVLDELQGEPSTSQAPTETPTPVPVEDPARAAVLSNIDVVPSIMTRATQAAGGAMQAVAQEVAQTQQTERTRMADSQAEYVLRYLNRPNNRPGAVTLPEVTILNRSRLEKALESSMLNEAQKTALRAHLGQ